jgi:hypothetical protein
MTGADAMEAFVVAHAQDRFAGALVEALGRAGQPARRLDVIAAAQALTITVGDSGADVRPAVPMVLRCPVMPETDDPDVRFLYGECLATLWAAAALTEAPVLGRPGVMGFGGACATSAVVTELRGGVFHGREEVFLNGAVRHQTGPEWWFQDQSSMAVASAGQNAAYPGPQRGRPLQRDEEYELVVVLGEQVWRRTTIDIPGVDLIETSRALARRLKLDFSLVVWAISSDRKLLGLARITPWPALEDISFAWDAVIAAIIGFLWHDHGHRTG